ncbi:MAG: glycosyltransferase family 39 protein [Planctomycetes bacterium]|nr:glycosyltransferase family 39 protein [Planctomycetota bacterium]
MSDAPIPLAPSNPQEAPAALPREKLSPQTWAWLAALLGWTVVLSFFHLKGGADFEPTEAWVAQTAREMSESTDWTGYIIPHFSGEVRMQKSPGPYWAVVVAAWLRGTAVDIPAARIPSGISNVLLVLTIFWLALRIAGQRAAVFAGFAAASSAGLLYWSHRGASDLGVTMLGVTMFMTVALASFSIACEQARPGRERTLYWMLAYFAAGLAMLYKMPMPLVCVGLPAALHVLIFRRWDVLRSVWHLVGAVLFLLPWLPWVIALAVLQGASPGGEDAGFLTTLNKWRVEFLDRFTGDLPNIRGQRTNLLLYGLYIGVAFAFTLPYCLSIPGAIVRACRSQPGVHSRGRWFLLIWLLSLFAFFTYNPGKETRYFLPMLPPMLMLLGIELAAFFDPQAQRSPMFVRLGLTAVGILTPAGWIVGGYFVHRLTRLSGDFAEFPWSSIWPPYAVAAAIFCAGVLAAAWLFGRQRHNGAFAALVATMFATWLWVWPNLTPIFSSERTYIDFANQLRDKLTPQQQACLFQVAQQDSRVVWYSNVRFPRIIDQLKLLKMQDGRRSVETEERLVALEMINKLKSPELALFVIEPELYIRFHSQEAIDRMRAEGVVRPRTWIWLTGRVGRPDHRYILFGNQPPPWPEPKLALPEKFLNLIVSQTPSAAGGPASRQASETRE